MKAGNTNSASLNPRAISSASKSLLTLNSCAETAEAKVKAPSIHNRLYLMAFSIYNNYF